MSESESEKSEEGKGLEDRQDGKESNGNRSSDLPRVGGDQNEGVDDEWKGSFDGGDAAGLAAVPRRQARAAPGVSRDFA